MDSGRLQLELAVADGTIVGAGITSTRPAAARLLLGKAPTQALALVPLLFSLCGRAQRAVAAAALAAASGDSASSIDARPVRTEALQETVWRLFLDWPAQFGFARREFAFANLHRRLAAATAADVDTIERLLAAEFFGVPPAAWRDGERLPDALAARLLAAVDALPPSPPATPALLPRLAAGDAAALLGAGIPDFERAPQIDGQPAETGALARHAAAPEVAARIAAGKLVAARLAARLFDLCSLRDILTAPPAAISALSPEAGVGVAVSDTARGQLIHWVRVDSGRVVDYRIVAPTEWNFHPRGNWRAELLGAPVAGVRAAADRARVLMLSLDPCVEFEITVNGSVHA